MLPAHVALPMHLPGIFYTGVKVRIPLAICNQKYDNCNLAAEVRTLGRIVTFSSFWFCYKHPNLSIDLSHKHKNDLCIPAPRYLLAGSPKNMNQPLELQLGLLGPANSAHPRSQSNRICTLPGLYTYIYIYIFIHPTHFSHLRGRSFSRRLSFHLSSQQLSLLSFSLIMFEKKFPGAPCTCCVANASSSYIPHCGESTDTSCNQKYLQSG